MFLIKFPPMGVYETLFKFADATSQYMGDPGTHPWAQGYPMTSQVPGGPELPTSISIGTPDRMYPKATGEIELRTAIASYYNNYYDAGISPDNVAVFAGGRPAIYAALAYLKPNSCVTIEETEYTPYYDVLERLPHKVHLIQSDEKNRFRPSLSDHTQTTGNGVDQVFLVKSNPCNPTGVATTGDDLKALVDHYSRPGYGALIDEAYEFFGDPEPVSALRYIEDINQSDIFVIGAATKGLQVPGMRVGWAIASLEHIEIFRNYSSFGMGGVSRASQLYVAELMEKERIAHARRAIAEYYTSQRKRYGEALAKLGLELYTGSGGFYHWCKLPGNLTTEEFNQRLFQHKAGILPGRLCDMKRRDHGPDSMERFIRFSFGPLSPESFEEDIEILSKCV